MATGMAKDVGGMRFLVGSVLLAVMSTTMAAGAEMAAGAATRAGASGTLRIAVLPFTSEPAAGTDVAGVIEADLTRSGAFKTLARTDALTVALAGQSLDAAGRQLRAAGATHALTGAIENGRLRYSLRELSTDAELLGSSVAVARPQLMRDAAHRVADSVYERLTGVPGIFGTKLLFVEKKGEGNFQLMVSDADGENPRLLAASREPMMSPAWSPDGKHVAFAGYERGRSAVFVLTLASLSARTLVADPGVNGAPAWSPDGRSIALTMSSGGSADIWVIDVETGTRRQLTTSRAIDTEPTWSPDGRSIAFTSDRGGNPQIYVMPSSGGEARRLQLSGRQNLRPQYAPDGRTMAVVNFDGGKYRIAVVDLQTGSLRRVTDGPYDEGPSFSPNGKALTYCGRGKNGRSQLHIASLDGLVRHPVRSGEDGREPAWSPLAK